MTNELLTLGAAELARRIRAGELTPTEVVEAHLARIEAVNPRLNALVTPLFESAREQARAMTEQLKAGADDLPPLFGVPVTIKDAFAVKGVRFTAGSSFRRDHVAEEDAAAVKRLREAGAILLGKTNCPDMSWIPETENPLFGLTRNPWNLRRTAGGSSGGEAALIAAGGSPLGLGSDIAGSIRLPAAMCGTVGLKPTAGRIPTDGHIPAAPAALHGWNTAGPLARRVEDLALALHVLSETPVCDFRQIELAGRRVVVYIRNPILPVWSEVAEAVSLAAGALRALGLDVRRDERLPLPQVAFAWLAILQREGLRAIKTALGGGEPVTVWREFVANGRAMLRGEKPRISSKALWIVWLISAGRLLRPFGFGRMARLDRCRARVLEALGPGGVLLCPVFPTPPPRHGFTYTPYGAPAYTLVFNALGLPGVSVPVSWSRGGLPLNVQVVAPPGEDETALAVAAALEQTFGGWRIATYAEKSTYRSALRATVRI